MESLNEMMASYMRRHNVDHNYEELMSRVLKDPDVQAFLAQHATELNEDAVQKSAAKLYEFVNEKDKVANGQSSFATGYEPRLVYANHLIDVAYEPTRETKQREQQQILANRVHAISMPKNIREASLENFDVDDASRKEAISAALDFIDVYSASPKRRHQALYLYGSFGVGKTYLLGAVANELAERGFKTTLVHFPSFAVEMKSAIATNSVQDKLDAIKRAPILMIDDIGADAMSAWVRDEVFGVMLEYRMQEELPTFFSSNFSMAQLEREHLQVTTNGGDEPLKAQRLMQRIRFLAREIEMIGVNRRPH
ncbi:primosomal protein DnaI [Levilactobacillus bambusae]|uniref:Primosomal protein DnaI n=1 Tax=Levilactobacillus bambusae TaxID=2024736 RepID=A0A2V1N1D7_9LACO|nr:primosomal protein DnaI [Levilactobacillus bambusae]PWG01034.1 primosomal protein DnaI [Levilactobacillus bambusae]